MPRARSRRAKATAAQTVRGVGGARKFDHNEYAVVNGTASTMALMPEALAESQTGRRAGKLFVAQRLRRA